MAERDDRTPAERACCHLGAWGLDGQSLAQWREEFRSIPRSEHCGGCPVPGRPSKETAP